MSNVWLGTYRAALGGCTRSSGRQAIPNLLSAVQHCRVGHSFPDGRHLRLAQHQQTNLAQYLRSSSRRCFSSSTAVLAKRHGTYRKKQSRPYDHAKPKTSTGVGEVETGRVAVDGEATSSIQSPVQSEGAAPDHQYYTLPDQPFGPAKIEQIFGKEATVTTREGNYILAVLHQRRLSGSIAEEGISKPSEGDYWSRPAAAEALQWLRLEHPVDEEASTAQWAEEEAQRLEQELYMQRGVRWGLIKSADEDTKPTGPAVSPYAGGALNELTSEIKKQRKANEKKREQEKAEEERQEQERMRMQTKLLREREPSGAKDLRSSRSSQSTAITGQQRGDRQVRRSTREKELEEWGGYEGESEWSRAYRREAAASSYQEPPKMTKLARLGPSTIVTAITIIGCLLFAGYYSPSDLRLFPFVSPSAATCGGIIALNTLVLFAWRFPPAWRMMNKYFVMAPGYPYAASIIGNIFSHTSFSHFSINMLFVGTGGILFHEMVGRGDFLALYIGAGAFGSWLSLTTSVLGNVLYTSTFGASACVCGLIAGAAILAPDHTWILRLPFTDTFVHVWTLIALPAFMLADVVGLIARKGLYDHWSHLGGYASGIVGSLILQRGYNDRAKTAELSRRKGGIGGNAMWRQDAGSNSDS